MHLTDEIMAQLIDGNICEKDREKYLKHISECKECFEIYSESIRSLESIEKERSPKRIVMVLLRKRRFIPLLMAAVLLISFPSIWKAVNKSTPIQPTYELVEISVANGTQEELILKDQTRVILDSGTTFKYPETFKNETREVFLSGEAYFEVSRSRERPFIVHAEHAIIKVLGTKFSIRAWENTKKVKVAVADGKVKLLSDEANLETGVLISTGQMSILPKNGQPSIPEQLGSSQSVRPSSLLSIKSAQFPSAVPSSVLKLEPLQANNALQNAMAKTTSRFMKSPFYFFMDNAGLDIYYTLQDKRQNIFAST